MRNDLETLNECFPNLFRSRCLSLATTFVGKINKFHFPPPCPTGGVKRECEKKRPEKKKRTTRHTTMWKWRKIDKIHVERKTKRSWAAETSVCLGGMEEQACILYFNSVWKINKWKFAEKICFESALVWSGSLLLAFSSFLLGKSIPMRLCEWRRKKCVTRKWIIFID